MSLPNIFVFQFANLYARFVKENVANYHGFIQLPAIGSSVMDPCSKFTVERTKRGDGLVHLRCVYNNKYLVRQSNTSTWIVANAEEPEEDQSKWSCTLFRPTPVSNAFQFMHLQLQRFLMHELVPSTNARCLRASAVPSQAISYRIFDWETLFIMPRYVSFKGDNDKYLSVTLINAQQYLQFASDDKADPSCWFEVSTANDGSIRLRPVNTNLFWRLLAGTSSPNWIVVDLSGSQGVAGLFRVIKVGDNRIAISNNSNGRFCERANITGVTRDCLRATSATISQTTRLVLEEAVLSRRVDNVIYRLMDSRIYNERALMVASNEAVNKTQEVHDMQLHFSYSESSSSTWNAVVSGSFGISANFRAGIPFLFQKQISISVEVSGGYEWGKTVEQSTEVSTTYDVTVPPNTKVIVRLLATEASFDIPFAYVQRDTLFDGTEVISELDGGMFNGVNSYNFRYEIEEQKLDAEELMDNEKTSKMVEAKVKVCRSSL